MRRSLLLFLSLICSPELMAERTWIEVTSPHFTVLTDGGAKAGRRVAHRFEQVRRVFEESFPAGRLDPGKPFVIIAGRNSRSLREFVPQFRDTRGKRRFAGFFVTTEVRCFVIVNLENPVYSLLTHEYVHLLNSLNFAYLPLWLNEGLAEFYETMSIRSDHVRIGDVQPRHLDTLARNALLPMDVFAEVDRDSPFYNESKRVSVFYAQAWALTHYLLTHSEARSRLEAFLRDLAAGQPMDSAFTRAFGRREDLEKKMLRYTRQRNFYYVRLNVALKNKLEKYPTRSLSDAETLAWKGIYVTSSQPRVSPEFSERALALDADSGLALEGLGYYWYRNGDRKRALETFEKAVALETRSPLAHFFIARILADDTNLTEENMTPIIDHYKRAIELAPEFSPALADLGYLYSRFEKTRPWSIILIEKAISLDRGNFANWLLMVHALTNAGRIDEAIDLLHRMTQMAGDRRQRDRVRDLREQLSKRAAGSER